MALLRRGVRPPGRRLHVGALPGAPVEGVAVIWRRSEFSRSELSGDLGRFVGKYVLVQCGATEPVAWYVDRANTASLELANGYRLHRSGKIRDEDNNWVGGKLISPSAFDTPAEAVALAHAARQAGDRARAAHREDALRARTNALAHRVWRKAALEKIAAAARAMDDDALMALYKSLTGEL